MSEELSHSERATCTGITRLVGAARQGRWKLAGGEASPRAETTGPDAKARPPRQGLWNSAAPAGAEPLAAGFRWLAPPANFRGASGSGDTARIPGTAPMPIIIPMRGTVPMPGWRGQYEFLKLSLTANEPQSHP